MDQISMLTKRYLASTKNVPAIMQKIVSGTAPEHFSYEHLKNIGFGGSNDRAIIPLLKELKFLTSEGAPTQRYHEYRNASRSKKIMADALREAYSELFHVNEKPTRADKSAIEGIFKSTHNVTDRVAEAQATTFYALLDLADLNDASSNTPVIPIMQTPSTPVHDTKKENSSMNDEKFGIGGLSLRYNIEIHLPATKDIEVYNAIFKALKENLVD
jgi:hypothetical protein